MLAPASYILDQWQGQELMKLGRVVICLRKKSSKFCAHWRLARASGLGPTTVICTSPVSWVAIN